MKKLLLIILLFIISCAPKNILSKPISSVSQNWSTVAVKSILIDEQFNSRERLLISQAISEWTTAANGVLFFNIQYNFDFKNMYGETVDTIKFLSPPEPNLPIPQNLPNQINKENSIVTNISVPYHSLDRIVITKRNSNSEVVKRIEKINKNSILGATFTYIDSDIIIIVSDLLDDDARYKKTVLHEISHVILGFGHNNLTPSILNEFLVNASDCLTKTDLQLFCKIYKCDLREMNYCK